MASSAHRLARLVTGFQRYLCMLPLCFHDNVVGRDLSTLFNKYCIVLHVVFFFSYLLSRVYTIRPEAESSRLAYGTAPLGPFRSSNY